jgi:YidC/Oxa1 family membrane protein insertase
MNQTRTFLLFAWIAVAVLLFMRWNESPAPAPVAATAVTAAVPAGAPPSAPAVPAAGAPPAAATVGAPPAASAPVASGAPITVTTDVLRLQVDPRGGTLIDGELLRYPVKKEHPDVRVHLLDANPATWSVAQSGLVDAAGGDSPNHEALFRAEDGRRDYQLADGADSIEVPLVWESANGLHVRKVYVLHRGSYAITVRTEVRNDGAATWRGFAYEQLQRAIRPKVGNTFTNPESISFQGAAWYDPEEKFEKVPTEDLVEDGPQTRKATGGWIGMLQHHFAIGWIPAKNEPQEYTMTALAGTPLYQVRGVSQSAFDVAPGMTATREATLWVGPKLQEQLQKLGDGMNLTLDYGMFTFIAQPMFDYVLSPLHWLTGNWGWAIILTVVILKLVLLPLSAAQYRSAARMRAIQPRLEALKERYGDDRQKYAEAQMELFRKEKINPMGGCLPILVTFPIFIALYYMLLETVEMRQAPFIGWIQNLTAPDPLYILPVLNLAVMFLTQKMTPMPGMDPMQKKIMTFMPLAFGVMMAFFPAGLVLYWVTNGGLGLLQQYLMTKRHGGKPGAPTTAVVAK